MGATLEAASRDGGRLRRSQYQALRERILSYIPDDPDFESVLPDPSDLGWAVPGETLINGQSVLAMGAAFLRKLASGPSTARVLASTDLMEQAERLMDDREVHVAAPIVLAGAALEEMLRDLVEGQDLATKGKPGLTTYAEALRADGALGGGDVKDIISLADVRNDAAHGDFSKLTTERARIFLDRVNFMLQKLTSA